MKKKKLKKCYHYYNILFYPNWKINKRAKFQNRQSTATFILFYYCKRRQRVDNHIPEAPFLLHISFSVSIYFYILHTHIHTHLIYLYTSSSTFFTTCKPPPFILFGSSHGAWLLVFHLFNDSNYLLSLISRSWWVFLHTLLTLFTIYFYILEFICIYLCFVFILVWSIHGSS